MAQTRLFNFEENDSTFLLNQRELVVIPYGRYCGFDPLLASGLTLTLNHLDSGRTKVDENFSETAPLGIWKTKQGVYILEDAAITLPISAGHSSLARIDLIVGEHEYTDIAGGTSAIYKVIQGTPGSGAAPAPTIPNKQTILGQILIPAGTTNLNGAGVVYTQARIPDFGDDETLLHTDKEQSVGSLKEMHVQKGVWKSATLNVSASKVTLPLASNYYYIGTVVGTPSGYTEVATIETTHGVDVSSGATLTLFSDRDLKIVGTGNILCREQSYIRAGEYFKLVSIGDVPSQTKAWLLVTGGEAVEDRHNKFLRAQLGNKSTASINNNAVVLGAARANYLTIEIPSSGYKLQEIESFYERSIYPTSKASEFGTWLLLDIVGRVTLKHNTGSASTDYKLIKTITGVDEVVQDCIVLLVEEADHWKAVNIYSATHNLFYVLKNLTIAGLGDTTITTPATGDVLRWNGSGRWVNVTGISLVSEHVPPGVMVDWPGLNLGSVPAGYLAMTGQVVAVADYPALFALFGDQFGGNGTTTFGIPDTRGRVMLGAGGAYSTGDTGGVENVTLTKAQLPKHSHVAKGDGATMNISSSGAHNHSVARKPVGTDTGFALAVTSPIDSASPASFHYTTDSEHTHANSDFEGYTGDGSVDGLDGQPHTNMMPYLAVIKIIKYR